MRPDEHKKKKNAQYKKKHGIKEERKGETSKDKKGSSEEILVNTVKSDISDSSDSSHNSNVARFSRRIVKSNWEKYELPPEEDPYIGPTQKGESFEKLLRSEGASAAQFRFKDEAFWEEEAAGPHYDQMSIDLMTLADSLQSLPLYQKLGISKEHFTKEQLQVMETQSMQNSFVKDNIPKENNQHCPPQRNLTNDTKENPNSQKDLCKNGKTQPKTDFACVETDRGNSIVQNSETEMKYKPSTIEDQELDALLSMETTEKTQNPKNVHTTGDTADDLEDWLDSILD
ncbi:cell death regulator Aven-like [Saccostrea echinata]|uniref:cell death regulator Aven-like n=1 Tax=Saccostrea echinata TaxID=191078 RepID=UPI002A839C0A|nr:cell death regulator Aven-like [Saccostrea echinata]